MIGLASKIGEFRSRMPRNNIGFYFDPSELEMEPLAFILESQDLDSSGNPFAWYFVPILPTLREAKVCIMVVMHEEWKEWDGAEA